FMTAACAPLRSSPTLQNTYFSFLEIVWAGWFHRSLHEGGTLGRTRPTKFLQSAEYADCRDGPHVRCAGWKPDEQLASTFETPALPAIYRLEDLSSERTQQQAHLRYRG